MMHLTVSAKLFLLTFILLYLTCSVESDSIGALRFYRNGYPTLTQAWSSGIVQIYYELSEYYYDVEFWGNICDNFDFGSTEADVICHQFGYSGASSNTNTGLYPLYGNDSSSTHLDDVSCSSSSYLAITQCSFSTTISSYCTDNTDVIVTCYNTRIWNDPSPGDIRLTGGYYSNEGLLEVYCNGEWGTVCDDTFSDTEAYAACKQLGYNRYKDYNHLSSLQGLSSQSIWLDALYNCSSSDRCLTACQICPSKENHDCIHSEDVTLECEYTSSYSQVTTSTNSSCNLTATDTGTVVSQGALRFYRNGLPTLTQAWSSGIVQIYYSGTWGNICDDYHFGSDEADVICHQLGYSGASSHTNTGDSSLYGDDDRSTLLSKVSCSSSSYLAITQCSFSTFVFSHCRYDEYNVIVTCYTTRIWNNPRTGDIRLTGGTYSNEGLLEVYCNEEWGTVCDDTFLVTDARVACRQLGYNDYTNYDHLSLQGLSSQSIWLDALYSCSSSDICLTSCQACPTRENHNCDHSEDVTLQCEYDSSYYRVYTSTNPNCSFTATDDTGTSAGVIAGAVIGSIVGLIICIAIFTLPFCICCCLGVGVGASKRSRPYKKFLTSSDDPETTTGSTPYTRDLPQAAHPPQGYSPQGYPPQGYSPQGYPLQAYPPQGNPLQGNPPKGNPPNGNPPQGNIPKSNPPNGNPPQGNIPKGNPPQGNPPQGNPPQGYLPQGYPPQGYPPQGYLPQGYPPWGYPPQGYPPQGYPPRGYPLQGYSLQSYPLQAYPPLGYPPQGNPQQGNPPQGNPPQGNPPQDNPPQGSPPQGNPPQGNPLQGNPPQDNPPQGNPQQGNPPQGNPPQDNPPQGNPPKDNPPQDNPPQDNPSQEDYPVKEYTNDKQ